MFAWFNEFSKAFPNWHPEYEELNSFVPRAMTN